VSAAPSVAVVDDAPLRANPAAELQAYLNDARQRIMLLESELELSQQAVTAFKVAFEEAERELKAAQDAEVNAHAMAAGESLVLVLILLSLHCHRG
jgi:hypothetical protein